MASGEWNIRLAFQDNDTVTRCVMRGVLLCAPN